jgi:hypothetical protein
MGDCLVAVLSQQQQTTREKSIGLFWTSPRCHFHFPVFISITSLYVKTGIAKKSEVMCKWSESESGSDIENKPHCIEISESSATNINIKSYLDRLLIYFWFNRDLNNNKQKKRQLANSRIFNLKRLVDDRHFVGGNKHGGQIGRS